MSEKLEFKEFNQNNKAILKGGKIGAIATAILEKVKDPWDEWEKEISQAEAGLEKLDLDFDLDENEKQEENKESKIKEPIVTKEKTKDEVDLEKYLAEKAAVLEELEDSRFSFSEEEKEKLNIYLAKLDKKIDELQNNIKNTKDEESSGLKTTVDNKPEVNETTASQNQIEETAPNKLQAELNSYLKEKDTVLEELKQYEKIVKNPHKEELLAYLKDLELKITELKEKMTPEKEEDNITPAKNDLEIDSADNKKEKIHSQIEKLITINSPEAKQEIALLQEQLQLLEETEKEIKQTTEEKTKEETKTDEITSERLNDKEFLLKQLDNVETNLLNNIDELRTIVKNLDDPNFSKKLSE